MELAQLLSRVDHTLLTQTATWPEIRQLCDDGLRCGCASVCIPPSYVKQAVGYLAGQLPVCTVIGFPNGYSTTAVKCCEAADAVANGAAEIDMVINLGWVKDGAGTPCCRKSRRSGMPAMEMCSRSSSRPAC